VATSKIAVQQRSVEERLDLIERLRASLEADDLPPSEAQRAELDRRIAEMDHDGERGIPWDQVRERIRGRLK
jgi:putative addiction module component (TIGR02574 family)